MNYDEDGSKTGQGKRGYLQEGAWDAIHVIEVSFNCNMDHAKKKRGGGELLW